VPIHLCFDTGEDLIPGVHGGETVKRKREVVLEGRTVESEGNGRESA